jgi:hypothetical protein
MSSTTTRKIILYPKSAMKPIILTDDSDQSLEDLQQKVQNILGSNKISIMTTSNDSLIIRPSEVQAVLITKKDGDNSDTEKKTDYAGKLDIDHDGNSN